MLSMLSKKGGQLMMNFNKGIIPNYSPITSKGGLRSKHRTRKNKSNKSRTRRRRKY